MKAIRTNVVSTGNRFAMPLLNDFISDLINIKVRKRKKYKGRKILALSIGLCLSLAFIIMAFEWKFPDKVSVVQTSQAASDYTDLMDVPVSQQPTTPPPKVQQYQLVEVTDDEIIEEVEVDFDVEITEETKIAEVVVQEVFVEVEEEKADEIFLIVEEQPLPVGGMSAFYSFVGENLHYPNKARRMGIEGRVFVQFVVEKDGSLNDIEVVRGIGAGCDEEAIRVLKMAPEWNPGKQRGVPVRVRMVVPIVFKLM